MHRHLALSMLAYSFLMVHSTSTITEEEEHGGDLGAFLPSVVLTQRHTTLPATIHRQVLMWLLEDLVLWFIETDRIKTFRPRRN